jgi:hypothetical protein
VNEGYDGTRNGVEADGATDPLELAPADVFDPVIAEYMKGVDMTLIIENLKLTPHERAVRMQSAIDSAVEIRRARGFDTGA